MNITENILNGETPVTEEELFFLAENHELHDLTKLDVSQVTNFSKLFMYQKTFNQPIDNWNVSSGTEFSFIFLGASLFNQPLIKYWKLSGSYLSQLIEDNFQLSKQHSFEVIGKSESPEQLQLLFKDNPDSPFQKNFNYNAKELVLIKTGEFYGFLDENNNAYQIDTNKITIDEIIDICDIEKH